MTTKDDLLRQYEPRLAPLLPVAQQAYGSRDTISPQHDVSREFTRLLCEFDAAGGSLLDMAKALGVTYAGLRRRVTTAGLPASSKRPRKKFSDAHVEGAVRDILTAKATSTEKYHATLYYFYSRGLSLTAIARKMGLSSANPLYYGKNRHELKLKQQAQMKKPGE